MPDEQNTSQPRDLPIEPPEQAPIASPPLDAVADFEKEPATSGSNDALGSAHASAEIPQAPQDQFTNPQPLSGDVGNGLAPILLQQKARKSG